MSKNFRLSLFVFLVTQIYFVSVQAQQLPSDPVDPDEPPALTTVELIEDDAKELFDVLNTWKLVVIDHQTQTKKIQTSDIVCVENMEDGRQLGCAIYDDLHSRDITKHNKSADPLFKVLIKHTSMDCADDSETCVLSVEKMDCTLIEKKYFCSMQILISQPKKKTGDRK